MFFLFLFFSCTRREDNSFKAGYPSQKEKEEPGLKVVTTTTMITDLVKKIGGERASVRGLMGPGIDPHLYRASEGNVILMAQADVVFYNGLHLEGKMSQVFEKMHGRVKTFSVTDGLDRSILLSPPGFEGSYDPHVWFDVGLWMKVSEYVRDSFIKFDPQNEGVYRENAGIYLKSLVELDRYIREEVLKVPQERRVLITAHDAFNYFGRSYGFEVRGLLGISTVSEAGTRDVQELARFIVEKRIPAIFVESSVPTRYIEALKEAVRAKGFDVKIGGSLFSDALGNPGTEVGTYVGMVKYNVDTIVSSLIQ